MNERLRRDAEIRPDVFLWNGSVPEETVRQWIDRLGIAVPEGLIDLWAWTGGGVMFETEEIWNPVNGIDDENSVEARNEWWHEQGLAERYLIFQEGSFFSAVRQPDGVVVRLNPTSLAEVRSFRSLDDWYLQMQRDEFASRYRLPQHDA